MNTLIRRFLQFPLAALIGLLATGQVGATSFELSAESAILVDVTTNTVLYEKDPDRQIYPSSMTKLMTTYMLFEQLEQGSISLTDTFPVSKKAWEMGGSKMWVEVGTDVTIEDLIRGIVVQSGNDATIVVAEGLAGSEEAFARQMTDTGRKIGQQNSVYRNASGWPDPEHITTARDLYIIARRTIEDFPQYYHYYAETTFTFNDIKQDNRNPLLYVEVGADGLKTGYTRAAGYGLTASAIRNGRRLILAANGFESSRTRAREARSIIDWGFREFAVHELFAADENVGTAEVWLGQEDTVPLVLENDLSYTLAWDDRDKLSVRIIYEGPVPAPVTKGQEIALLVVDSPTTGTIEAPLFAAKDVGELSLVPRLISALADLIFRSSSEL